MVYGRDFALFIFCSLQTVALLNSMCPRESTLSMGSPPSYYSTSQKPTEPWNKQVSMGGLSPHPRSTVPWSLHSNESNLALHETFLLLNENPVLSPFLMMGSCPLQAKDLIMDFSLTCSSCGVTNKRIGSSSFWPMSLDIWSVSSQTETMTNFWQQLKHEVHAGSLPKYWKASQSLIGLFLSPERS